MAEFKSLVQDVLGHVTQHLGEDAVFAPCNGSKISVRVVFDNTFELVDPDTETVIKSNQPRVLVRLSDYPNETINEGDVFTLNGKDYRVWTVQEDGQGGASVMLHKEDY